MPNIHEHLLFDQHFFGYTYGQYKYIHNLLDHGAIGYVATFSKGHRKYMHDSRAVEFVTKNYGILAGQVAQAHIALDKVWSESKRKGTLRQ